MTTKALEVDISLGHTAGSKHVHVFTITDGSTGSLIATVELDHVAFAELMASRNVRGQAMVWDGFDIWGDHHYVGGTITVAGVTRENFDEVLERLRADQPGTIFETEYNWHHSKNGVTGTYEMHFRRLVKNGEEA